MSADNWTLCPTCYDAWRARETQIFTEAMNAYGKVGEREYHEIQASAKAFSEKRPDQTLREDWSIGTDEYGQFTVDYRSSCSQCNYEFDYKIALSPEQIAEHNASNPKPPIEVAAKRLSRRTR